MSEKTDPLLTSRDRRTLLAFEWKWGCFQAVAQRPFRPVGLAIYGAPAGATVECFVGTTLQAMASWGDVPARFFASDLSFEQIAAKLDEGIETPAWVQWDLIGCGIMVTLRIFDGPRDRSSRRELGPDDGVQLVMWGIAAGD